MPDHDKKQLFSELSKHAEQMRTIHMRDMFKHNADRGVDYTIELRDIFIDYSKNIITNETLDLLFEFANTINIKKSIDAMFAGEKINYSEKRAVLHTALRSSPDQQLQVDNIDITKLVHSELAKIQKFTEEIHSQNIKGWTNKAFDTFVNIGIGGSDLGPRMVVDALDEYRVGETRSFFISNIDYREIDTLKKTINPETTLFIVSSKSFSTIETLFNTDAIKLWLQDCGCDQMNNHFVAVTANKTSALEFGIDENNIFNIWDWVGGRFSLWSATGIPIALAIGFDNFKALLNGANKMDRHFKETPIDKNAPVLLALLDFWYNNFLDAETHAFIPYDESLKYFPDYLSQLFMESNGKSVNSSGHRVDYKTMPVTWGTTGTNSQHAFFQLLHQGTHLVPIDFMTPLKKSGRQKHHALLLANCFAQSQALMQGEENPDTNQHFEGNKPSTTILYDEIKPDTLGELIALFEHRTFIQGLLWDINSFDQWGVDLGKKLAMTLFNELNNNEKNDDLDSSTRNLIEKYKQRNK